MTAVALDTNAYMAFRKGFPDAVELLTMVDHIVMPTVVLGELRAGFALGSRTTANERDLTRFLSSSRVDVQAIDERTSVVYGSVFMQLRKRGTPIPTNDLWIAASALVAGTPLFTFDAHFAQVDQLKPVARWADLLQ